jgi:hypothetical protein
MSIWASVGEPVAALDGSTEAANYRAEGKPSVTIVVATTHAHDHVRLAMWGAGQDVTVILSPATVRLLAAKLNDAVAEDR